MVPMTAQRIIDIHINASRLLPKPMLANAAKITRMLTRRKKRTSTWMDFWGDFCSRDRFGSCAKSQNSGIAGEPRLREIVAAERLIERVGVARYGGHARPALGRADTLGLDERAQDRQRQIRMTGLDRSIEPVGKLALARQRAVPLALVIGDAANLPERQLEVDQRQRGVGPGAGCDQVLDPCRLPGLSDRGKAPAGLACYLRHQF